MVHHANVNDASPARDASEQLSLQGLYHHPQGATGSWLSICLVANITAVPHVPIRFGGNVPIPDCSLRKELSTLRLSA